MGRKGSVLVGLLVGTILFYGVLLITPQNVSAVAVDLELALLVDVSGSISTSEFNLQRQGYVDAFNSASLWTAIQQGTLDSIAVTLVYWSGENQQTQAVGWTLIDSYADSQAFATSIFNTTRPYNGQTAVQNALSFAANSLSINSNGFEGTRQVIDVSGDGTNNDGLTGTVGRDQAVSVGYDAINGLVIGNDANVLAYYQNNVQSGPNSFVVKVDGFDDFGPAIQNKLEKEIIGTPEPATMFLLGFALVGLAGVGRKFKK